MLSGHASFIWISQYNWIILLLLAIILGFIRHFFNLNRPNIFPTKDIGLLRAISKNYKTSYPPSKIFLNKISKLHNGYRSVFTWYMWRSIDPTDVEY